LSSFEDQIRASGSVSQKVKQRGPDADRTGGGSVCPLFTPLL